jgi:glycosyltransferase involved in cell wall biosynthesis
MKNLEEILGSKRKPIRAIYVSSYIPRKCGIATYTKDLTNAINPLNPYALAEIMAINRTTENLNYPWEAKFKIDENNLSTYLQAADYINRSGVEIVSLQHEFGLFGSHRGENIVPFVESLKRPLVTTLHTVLDDSGSDGGTITKRLIEKSAAVVVMMEQIKDKIIKEYHAPAEKIVIIPHGTPDLPLTTTDENKKRKKLSDRIVLGNINLLSECKGIEYSLEATSIIAKELPNVLYLVIGQTHPADLHYKDEKYRKSLIKLVKKLKIEKNVRFINKYISLEELVDWIQTMDFYITPYLDPQQVASGALAYAVGAGKCCVSSSYLYAKEVLADGRGVTVPFRDPKAIASAVIRLWKDKDKKEEMERKAYAYGRLMTWSNVALQYLNLFAAILSTNGYDNHNANLTG